MIGNVHDLARALNSVAPDAALALLGEPTHRMRQQFRWGTRGSLSLEIAGPRRGIWCDHETGEGGDMLALVRRQHHGAGRGPATMRAAIDWARGFLGMPAERTGKPAGAPRAARAPERQAMPEAAPDPSRTTLPRHVWCEAVPIAGTIAETYLRDARGIRLPTWPTDLRFHPCCRRGSDRLPALLAVMRDPVTGDGVGVQRIFLRADGSDRLRDRMGKAMLGNAGVVMLSPFVEVTHGLHIAEGVESTLSALAIGLAPAWAAGSAGAIAGFPVLPGIECLTILADNDVKGGGLAAAEACAARWCDAGCEARIITPLRAGHDFNDLAREIAA
jgi:hypothetical protein